jgi:hypothetical protein
VFDQPNTYRHIENLANYMTRWTSIDVTVRCLQVGQGRHAGFDTERLVHYVEHRRGDRFMEETSIDKETGIRSSVKYYHKEDRCVNLTFHPDGSQRRALISREQFGMEHRLGSTKRPSPLVYLYVGKVPIYEALIDAEPLGQAKRLERPCDQYLFRQVRWGMVHQDLVYCLDRETSAPLEVASYLDELARREGRPVWVWRAKTFNETDGLHMPLASETISYDQKAGHSTPEVRTVISFKVEALDYNESHPASTFWPTFQPGVEVIDDITGKFYTVGQDRAAEVKTVAEPIRAVPEPGWTAWLSSAGLILGISILAVSAFLWLRRGR